MNGFSVRKPNASPRRRRRAFALLGLAILGVCADVTFSSNAASQSPETFQVIINAKNPVGVVDREFLSDVFLKRVSQWQTSESVSPVDLRGESQVRQAFSMSILKRPVAAIRSYWTQRIFSGREIPPPELESEDAVGRYVANHPGAVGYIAAGGLPAGTKRLEVR
jgi:ABC-type phosphate transport system substrate-binding protein